MSKRNIVLFLFVLAIFTGGYTSGRWYRNHELKMANHLKVEHGKMNSMEHKYEPIQVDKWRVEPKVNLEVIKDSMEGYNLRIKTSGFYFTPSETGKAARQNTGHAHIMVNNEKIARAYGEWIHIRGEKFTSGTNTISVTLNANNHAVWLDKKGGEIVAKIELFK